MTITTLQIINSLFLIAVLPFSISLILSLVFHTLNNRDDIVRYILILVFTSITIAAVVSLHVNYLILIEKASLDSVELEANFRNVIKNFSFFVTAMGFWYIEIKSSKKKRG